jgi:hypothetical protein
MSLKRGVVVLVLSVSLFAWLGCSPDECESDDVRCDGETALTCVGKDTNFFSELQERGWHREVCTEGTRCVVARSPGRARAAFCALATSTDSRCPGPSPTVDRSRTCDDTHVLACREGFLVADDACSADTRCVTPVDPACSNNAFCATTDEPDPLCAGQAVTACDGNQLVTCSCGLRESAHPCVNPGPTCVVLTAGTTSTRQVAACR